MKPPIDMGTAWGNAHCGPNTKICATHARHHMQRHQLNGKQAQTLCRLAVRTKKRKRPDGTRNELKMPSMQQTANVPGRGPGNVPHYSLKPSLEETFISNQRTLMLIVATSTTPHQFVLIFCCSNTTSKQKRCSRTDM